MKVDIGQIIKAEVEAQRYTQKEFGALIHRHEKTVPDIYDRTDPCIGLLIRISAVLQKDFLRYFYEEEPLKSLRNDAIKQLQEENRQIQVINDQLKKDLAHQQELIEVLRHNMNFARELISQFKVIHHLQLTTTR